MNNPSKSCYYFFSAIESGEQIDVKEKEGHEIYHDAEEALKKQIPENPIRVNDGANCETDGCPECGTPFYNAYKYCPSCGQALKWGE